MSLKHLLLWIGAAGVLLQAAAAVAQDRGSAPAFVVYCFDQKRNVVTRDLASACQGTVVSEAEARAIEERRSRAIMQGLATHPGPAPAGTRLASIGTAFFIDESGKLLTNDHVVRGCTAVVIETAAADALPAKLLALDAEHDLALLQVPIKPPAVAPFRAQMLTEPGAFVADVGYPDQGLPPREPIVTSGVLEAPPPGRSWDDRVVIKGNIRPGDSGSPLMEQHGLVIGVMNAKLNTVAVYRQTGRVVIDVGFGISLQTVLGFLKRNDVVLRFPQAGKTLDAAQILDVARDYVARADCWK